MPGRRPGGRRVMARRAHYQRLIDSGQVICPRCGLPIERGQPWDLGHVVPHALGGTFERDGDQPEHAYCNRAAGGRLAHTLAAPPRRPGVVPSRRSWL
ncbi:MAG: hypothetical protein KJ792_02755 [Actinobacteria bacterium]|nr:hypothetical protein [Actinomycetota bacterium]MCG2800485.1 hypothetical protein [Cellulomonas sp.]